MFNFVIPIWLCGTSPTIFVVAYYPDHFSSLCSLNLVLLCSSDPPKSEPPPQAVPGNAPVPVMNVVPPQPPQMNVLQHHYPMQTMQGALPVSLQPAAPYAMPPQVPMHLHPAVPLLQVPAVGAQGLPPPPPPPPPMQAGSQTAAAQPDGQTTTVR